ncbi:MAG: hypothetical protein SYR96_19040 [Actinomycetota bacterium]|nr:hypothetical protein [Actinomycetota bacterium]
MGKSLRTVPGLDVGDRLTATAVVSRVLAGSAFTIRDADLPPLGLLVLGLVPEGLAPHSLVTVHGTVDQFDFERFSREFGLPSPKPFEMFADRKCLVAERTEVWA